MATDEFVGDWCDCPGSVVNAILCGKVGVDKRRSPLRRTVDCLLAEAAGGLCTVFAPRARKQRPRRGRGREPSEDGDNIRVTEEGGVRWGRNSRGEYRFGAEER